MRATARVDTWAAIPGETRWVDYSHQVVGEELVVYLHLFRRVRDRHDASRDVLFWKPATTKLAQRYRAGEWSEVVGAAREWPPVGVELVPRRVRHRPT